MNRKWLYKNLFLALTFAFSWSVALPEAHAGVINGTPTKIRAYEENRKIRFESRIPNINVSVRKIDIIKGMTKIGKTRTIIDIERDGLLIDIDKKVGATLDRVGHGLYIQTATFNMFITEKELDNVKKMRE
ncbi:hypothetical protein [Anaeroarcus burkinensis]|uniref:hypothetical protein n=1 Tax=Anaeroarcus burkinensis TaxID=82376 RepID=UPI000428863C|nr:hypothetical protein [Anaeroarcus burkinensis]